MSTLQSYGAKLLVSPRLAKARRKWADSTAKLRGEAPELTLYYQVGDAYSHLCAQLIPRLRERLRLEIKIVIVPFVEDATNAAPDLSPAYGVLDATRIAPAWGLDLTAEAQAPQVETREAAERLLLTAQNLDDFLTLETEIAPELWSNNAKALNDQISEHKSLDAQTARQRLDNNYEQLLARGHYQGGMWYFRGDWYWALDRLTHLEDRLRELDLVAGDPPLAELNPEDAYLPPLATPNVLTLFYSFRSPYSYLVIERCMALVERYKLELDVRPVLPMVMRGFKVPRSKRLYIIRDSKREADRLGVPFGKIADPLGGGVERCLAAFPLVLERGQATGKDTRFVLEAGRAIWSRGRNIKRNSVLRKVLRRAGADPGLAARAPADGVDLSYAERNREALFDKGLWGVPSFKLGDLAVWGQDRVWLLEEALRRSQV